MEYSKYASRYIFLTKKEYKLENITNNKTKGGGGGKKIIRF